MNWDPVDHTVLANEQVDASGRSWRSGALVEKRPLRQWYFKVTHYAEDLLANLDNLPGWPEPVKRMQRQWIGKSEGCSVVFKVPGMSAVGGGVSWLCHALQEVKAFTTRVDTLFGVTFVAIAPVWRWT